MSCLNPKIRIEYFREGDYLDRAVALTHFDFDGRARFVTFSTHRRLPVLTNDRVWRIVTDSIDEIRKLMEFQLIAYVLMPEHIHLVLLPNEKTEVGRLIGEIERISSKGIHELLVQQDSDLIRTLTVIRNGECRFALWKRRCYDHNCRSNESVWQKVNYCHNNPVSRGLVRNPEDRIWSSCRWYQGIKDVPLKMDISVK